MDRFIEKTTALKKRPAPGVSKECAAKKLGKQCRGDSRPCFEVEHWGNIFIDIKYKRFEAQCSCIGADSDYLHHAPWCQQQDHRTPDGSRCSMQRVGAKSPLGFLVAWLREGFLWPDHKKHLDGRVVISREQRVAGREWLQGQPDFAELLKQEKKWAGGSAGFDAAGNIEEPLLCS